LQAEFGDKAPEGVKKQIESWKKTAERYQTEPETGEGRKELAERAKAAEKKRDRSMAVVPPPSSSRPAAVQIAIVMARRRSSLRFRRWSGSPAALGVVGSCVLRDWVLVSAGRSTCSSAKTDATRPSPDRNWAVSAESCLSVLPILTAY
jgi:hypothetical protein